MRIFSDHKFKFKFIFCLLMIMAALSKEISTNIPTTYGPLTYENIQEINHHLEKIKTYITNSEMLTAGITLNTIGNFLQEKKTYGDHEDTMLCRGCLWVFNSIQEVLLKKYGWNITLELVSLLCSIGVDHNTCNKYVYAYGEIVIQNLVQHYFNGEYICTTTKLCNTAHFIYLSGDEYAKGLLKDKPERVQPDIDTEARIWKVLQVTDIHVDLHYEEGTRGLCPSQLCCRNEPGLYLNGITAEEKAGRWGYLGKCDIPVRTLENFAEKVFTQIKPDFIIWTGDNPAHDAYDNSAFEVAKKFTEIIRVKYNYTLPVYPSLGNHEKTPNDEYNPFSGGEADFLKSYADLWQDWLEEDSYNSFKSFGAYSKKHPNSNLRIVSTNCLLCDTFNFNLIQDPTDPQSQVEWLERVLRKAEEDAEIVYLIGHIPPGDGSFLSECAKRYKALLDRFSFIIRGQFYGHTHWDEIKISREYFNPTKVTGVSYIAPSLTTYTALNPSFRIYEVDANTKIIRDYLQYRMSMAKANLNPDVIPDWDIAYRATDLFKVKFLNETEALNKFVENIETDHETFVSVLNSFYSDSPSVETYITDKKMPKYLSCRFRLDIFDDYFACVGYTTWGPEDYAYKVLNIIGGSWFKKLSE